jgi:hypothetical protein
MQFDSGGESGTDQRGLRRQRGRAPDGNGCGIGRPGVCNRDGNEGFHMEAGKPKVGEKVTVYYDISRRDHRGVWFAMKIEKAGKSEKGSKKN